MDYHTLGPGVVSRVGPYFLNIWVTRAEAGRQKAESVTSLVFEDWPTSRLLQYIESFAEQLGSVPLGNLFVIYLWPGNS